MKNRRIPIDLLYKTNTVSNHQLSMLDFLSIKGAVFVMLMGMVSSISFANSVTLTSIGDTSLLEEQPNNNDGGNTSFVAGTNSSGKRTRGLVRFNLAGQIPSNASI